MAPDVSLLDHVKDVSPWVASIMIVAFIIDRVLKYLETRGKKDIGTSLEGLSVRVQTMSDSQSRFRDAINQQHLARVEEALKQQGLFQTLIFSTDRVVKELIALKAMQGAQAMSMEEAKLLIEYQWAWCRGEVIRVVLNSVENNHFRGNEDRVARSVQRAWKVGVQNAQVSLSRFSSLQYAYTPLFDVVLPVILDKIWKLAVPLYHASAMSGDYISRMEDFQASTVEIFNNGLDEYFRGVEDVDTGPMYAEVCRLSEEDSQKADYRSQMLSAYKEGGKSPPSGEFDVRETVRKLNAEICRMTPTHAFPALLPDKKPKPTDT